MDIADFEMMKQTIKSKDFESTRLSIAKQVLQENCLLAGQVNEDSCLYSISKTQSLNLQNMHMHIPMIPEIILK